MSHPSLYNFRRDLQPVEASFVPVRDKCAICLFPFGETDPDDNEITAAQECLSSSTKNSLPLQPTQPLLKQPTEAEMQPYFRQIPHRCCCRHQQSLLSVLEPAIRPQRRGGALTRRLTQDYGRPTLRIRDLLLQNPPHAFLPGPDVHLPPAVAQLAAQADGRIPPAPQLPPLRVGVRGLLRHGSGLADAARLPRHRAADRQDGVVRARLAQVEGDRPGGAGRLHDAVRGVSVLRQFLGHGRCVSGEGRVEQAGFYAGGSWVPGA